MTYSMRSARRTLAVSVAVLAVTVTAACGSSSSSGKSSGGGGGSTAAGGGGGGSAEVSAAAAAVAAAIKVPTTIPVTAALTSKPPTGKTFVFMKCDTATCVPLSDGMEQATKALGWTYKTVSYKSADPATLLSALRQALNYKPVAVGVSGIPPAAGWTPALAQYKAANIPIITSYLAGVPIASPIIANVAGQSTYDAFGTKLANWFIADSKGSGTAVLQRIDDFPVLKAVSDSFASTVASKCKGCKVISVKNTIADATGGKIVPQVISTLRSNRGAHYVVSCDAEFVEGFDAASAAAGLSGKVKLAGQGGTVSQLSALKAGTGAGAAYTGLALHYSGWAIVDAALRHLEGSPVSANNGTLPSQLYVKGGDFTASTSLDKPANYQQQFKTLWKLG